MQARMINLYFTLQNMLRQEEGQDLIEYALVVALIALAATAGMQTVATDINLAFSNIGSKLTSYTS
jgi:pilus assembly protein Flp/PilA